MRKDPAKRAILYTVLSAHLFFLCYIHFNFAPNSKKSHKPLVVKTLSASPSPKEKTVAARTQGEPKPKAAKAPAPSPSPAPKKQAATKPPAPATPKKAPPIADKKLAATKKEKKKASVESVQDEKRAKMSKQLLQELEESFSKLEAKPEKKKGSSSKKMDLPEPVGSLHSEASSFAEPADAGEYHAALISYLHETLNLPEYGEVKIQLTLRQDGTVLNLLVLKTESEKNRKYLETSLLHLTFPRLQGSKKQETFVVTFCNEI